MDDGSDRRSSGQGAGPSPRADLEAILSSRWPARSGQIRALLEYVWDPMAAMPPLLVYGGPSTGKTAIIRCPAMAHFPACSHRTVVTTRCNYVSCAGSRDLFKELGRPCCYISCVEFDRPRQLLQAILHRLKVLERLQLRPTMSILTAPSADARCCLAGRARSAKQRTATALTPGASRLQTSSCSCRVRAALAASYDYYMHIQLRLLSQRVLLHAPLAIVSSA